MSLKYEPASEPLALLLHAALQIQRTFRRVTRARKVQTSI